MNALSPSLLEGNAMRRLSKSFNLAILLVITLTWSVESFSIGPSRASYPTKDAKTRRYAVNSAIAIASTAPPVGFAVAGRLGSVVKKLMLIRTEFRPVRSALANAFDFGDVMLLGLLGWLTEPLAKRYFAWRHDDADDEKFEDTLLFRFASFISQLAKVTGIVYAFDMLSVVLMTLRFQLDPRIQPMLAKATYIVWGAWRIRGFKNFMLKRLIRQGDTGKIQLVRHILDGAIATCLFFFLQDIFHFSMGRGIASVLTAGGTAGLVFSLAFKELATEMLSGLAFHGSRKVDLGDKIRIGDGTTGRLVKVGAFETLINGSDGIIMSIPNSHVVGQRIQNLSRAHNCQVKQTLWFNYDDVDKMEAIVKAIKEEIRASCPKLITDGSRPFRVHFHDFKDDHLEVAVDVNFNFSPSNVDEYLDNRQVVLQAIARAVEKNGVEFALPNSVTKNLDITPMATNS